MSSTRYSACLQVDPFLRRLVLASGVVFAGTGLFMILAMPYPVLFMLPAAVAWLGLAVHEIIMLRRAYARYCALEFDNNEDIRLLDSDGRWHAARLLPGSLLLRRAGWLRIRDPSGLSFGEPVRGSCRDSREWRRLQLIWRHVGAHP